MRRLSSLILFLPIGFCVPLIARGEWDLTYRKGKLSGILHAVGVDRDGLATGRGLLLGHWQSYRQWVTHNPHASEKITANALSNRSKPIHHG